MTKFKLPIFNIDSIYNKLYDANGEKEVILTAQEADELLDYIQHLSWLTNPPTKNSSFLKKLAEKQYDVLKKLLK